MTPSINTVKSEPQNESNNPLIQKDIPQALPVQDAVENVNSWNGGLCDCFNNIYPSMLCSFFTPYIYSAMMYQTITKNKSSFVTIMLIYLISNSIGYMLYSKSKMAASLTLYGSNIYMLYIVSRVRTKLRVSKNIPGSSFEDTFVTIFCTPCSISQTGRTLYEHNRICDNFSNV